MIAITERNDQAGYDGSPSPCDSCSRKRICARQKLACCDLSNWLNQGSHAKVKPEAQRVALHQTYRRIFPGAFA